MTRAQALLLLGVAAAALVLVGHCGLYAEQGRTRPQEPVSARAADPWEDAAYLERQLDWAWEEVRAACGDPTATRPVLEVLSSAECVEWLVRRFVRQGSDQGAPPNEAAVRERRRALAQAARTGWERTSPTATRS